MKDISHLYGEPTGTIFEDYLIPELEEIDARDEDENLLKLADTNERRTILYYWQHRRGKTNFSIHWLPKIESAIAKYRQFEKEQASIRLAIYDSKEKKYWASLSGINPRWKGGKASPIVPYWGNKRKALLFSKKERDWLEEVCERSNQKTSPNRFVVVEVNALLKLSKQPL